MIFYKCLSSSSITGRTFIFANWKNKYITDINTYRYIYCSIKPILFITNVKYYSSSIRFQIVSSGWKFYSKTNNVCWQNDYVTYILSEHQNKTPVFKLLILRITKYQPYHILLYIESNICSIDKTRNINEIRFYRNDS